MEYPIILLPQQCFKLIEATCFETRWLCRTVPAGVTVDPDDFLTDRVFYQKWEEFYDYSTNLLGHFSPSHNYISLCGEVPSKRYFQGYWDFLEEVSPPIYGDNFIIDENKKMYFLPIQKIHNQVQIPFKRPPKSNDDCIVAIVAHTPTRSNFWHFSIQWVDRDGNIVKASDSRWKEERVATMRALFTEILVWEVPDSPPLELHCYVK